MQITVGKIIKCSTMLVFGSRSDFPQRSSWFALTYYCSQSSQIRRRCRNFCFDVFLVDSRMATCVVLQHHDGAFILFPLFSTRGLCHWILNCVGVILEPTWTLLNRNVNHFAPSVHQGALDRVAPPIGSTKPIVTFSALKDTAACAYSEICDTSRSKHGLLSLERHRCSASKFSYDSNSLWAKLSHGLVLTSWRAHPNYNLILNYAGSPKRFLRWKSQDGRRVSSEFEKRPLCNIRRNGWHITQGTQPERWLLPLESRSYNKSYSRPKAYCFSKIDERKPFLVVSNPCLTFLHSAFVLTKSTQYPAWCWFTPSPVVLILHDFAYLSYSNYPREGHLRSRRWSLQFRSSYSNGRC
jgi:hypothetical protein